MAEEEEAPPEPEIFNKCFETSSGQLFYGEVKAKEDPEATEESATEYVAHGKGLTIWSKNTLSGRKICFKKHTGDYAENEMSGDGTIEYYDGSVYKGELVQGTFEGEGTYTWPNNSFYKGTWKSNEMHGRGLFQIDWSGKFREGQFHRNCVQNVRLNDTEVRWVDILEEISQIEIQELSKTALRNDIARDDGPPVMTCSDPSKMQELMTKMIEEQNLIPLLVPDQSFGSGNFTPLDWVHMCAEQKSAAYQAQAVEPAPVEGEEEKEEGEENSAGPPIWKDPLATLESRIVHVGHIAKMKRRGYDYSALLFTALQTALLAEDKMCLVFDQYDEVKLPSDNDIPLPLEPPPTQLHEGDMGAMGSPLDDDEAIPPAPTQTIMARALQLEREQSKIHKEKPAPSAWKLQEFYDECSLPIRLWNPKMFHYKQGKIHELILDYAASRNGKVGKIGMQAAKPAEGAEEEAVEDPGTVVGLDIKGGVVDEKTFYHLEFCVVVEQPVVVRFEETRVSDIRTQLAERFSEHLPLHRVGVICCTMKKE
ncbi:unnamed protein product [Amoebophrya sp. A120]|nr:unnamed protein product [Amoebophrya sp. A120]|eukprot:GSA120T00025443001.1